jgi:hypothetical protein
LPKSSEKKGYGISDLPERIKGVVKHHLASQIVYTKTGLVFGFSKNQILVACPTCRSGGQLSPDWKTPRTFPGQKAPRTLLGQNCFWIFSENYFDMCINP